ncbi:hypothetical protein JIN85_19825 [Luteolibacter pohnpeiensis]|uniref:Uncharacterized protein n=1 Tax=Luteolibacter pohnpeiensis TaxID=454153 RepID=A0A934SAZ5_9BACT|nr:hypothetical protein [Luteolibacter pohnpeiensis]MBK1884670.1 hypothetical protein [Luteolibacter pohnpeiensis]
MSDPSETNEANGAQESGVDSDSIVASCECFRLSPNPIDHAKGCKYRLICERDAAREALLLAAQWGISSDGYSANVSRQIRIWVLNGMQGPAPKAPDYYPPLTQRQPS